MKFMEYLKIFGEALDPDDEEDSGIYASVVTLVALVVVICAATYFSPW